MEAEYCIEQQSLLRKHILAQSSTDILNIWPIAIPFIYPVNCKNPGREGPLMNKECHI